MTITCVITDDEPMARKGLQSYVERVDFLSLTGVCEDAIQLNTLLKTQQPDLLLLDIEMPYLSGLDLLATLNQPPKVIVTSAYEQYALKGYELDVVLIGDAAYHVGTDAGGFCNIRSGVEFAFNARHWDHVKACQWVY
jgi:DNA-binding LytR/AlgR family response regulator